MSKKSKKKERKAAKRAANKNAILKKDKPKTVEQNTGSPFPNFTAQTDNRKSNFKYIQPTAKTAKQTAKQQRADGAKNEKWQDEKYAAHMKKQAAKQKAKDKPAEKKTKLTLHEKKLAATETTNNLFDGMREYAEIEKLKANTNKAQIRRDLELLRKRLKKELTSKLFDMTTQLLHDAIILGNSPNRQNAKFAENIIMPRLYDTMINFFVKGGKWQNDTEKF